MKYFFDTEFIEDGNTIDLISIGIFCEDGRSLYLQNSECDFKKANDWVFRNVFPYLDHFTFNPLGRLCSKPSDSAACVPRNNNNRCPWRTKREIADEIKSFCQNDPEFWAYYADYDWVVLCQLFGRMIDLPKTFPMYCRDIKQLCDDLGNPALPKQETKEHNALNDAIWNYKCYKYLKEKQNGIT